ncbi:MAG: hypothetical protein ACRDMZ_01880 [Solirubrobacteraceae bacterium]
MLPVALLGAVALAAAGTTAATYSSQAANAGNRVSAAPDFRAPTVSAVLITKVQTPGSSTGYIRQGGSYRVYAAVSDTGNPASGTATVTADVSAFSSGTTAAPLTAGSYTIAGTTYTHRSAILTASTPVAEGTKSFSFGLADVALNSATASGYSVVVDNTAPAATDVQTTNSGIAGRPTNGDTMIYTYSEPIDPDTVLSGWDGSSTSVRADVIDGGSGLLGLGLGAGNDVFTVSPAAGGTNLPLTVGLGTDDYAYNIVLVLRVVCDATFHSSTMAMSASTITVTLGGSAGCPRTSGPGTMTYAPTAGPTDRAGNALPTTQRAETGPNDADF